MSGPRKLGIWMATALVAGNIIGTGVFMLPAALAPHGWSAILGWLVTLTGTMALALVFARLSRLLPSVGGPYGFTRLAFGDGPAFLVSWGYWISIWVGNAAIATGATSYLSQLFPSVASTPAISAGFTIAVVWLLTWLNARGAYQAGRFQVVTTALKLLPLIAALLAGAWLFARQGNAAVTVPLDTGAITGSGVLATATLTLWAMLGLESATVPADKVEDAERTIPRATLLGTGIPGVLMMCACTAVILMLPPDRVANSPAPFAEFVGALLGPWAGSALAALTVISGIGALNGWILLQGEVPNVMARAGVFPAWLAPVTQRGVPLRAMVLSSVLVSILLVLNNTRSMAKVFTFAALLSTTACLVLYLLCALAALRLGMRGNLPLRHRDYAAGVIASVYAAWAIVGAGAESVGWGLVLLAAGWPVYWGMRRTRVATRVHTL